MARSYGKPTEAQIARINQLSKTSLTADEVFWFNDKMIGDGLITDRYYRMMNPTLRDFREHVKEGVAFLLDHPDMLGMRLAMPHGRTFDAVLRNVAEEERTGDETKALFGDHYIPRGVMVNGIGTDDVIRQIETGIMFDTSIGFSKGKFICSICNQPYYGWDSKCTHFAGKEYDGKVCEVQVHPPAILNHNAGVYAGAYPGAGIGMSALSQMTERTDLAVVEDLKRLETTADVFGTYSQRYGLTIFAPRGAIINKPMILTQGKEEDALDKQLQELKTKVDELTGQLSQKDTALAQATQSLATETAAKEALQTQLTALQTDLDTQKAEVTRLQPLAEDGKAFKAYMIGEAHKWGVKAMGNAYKQDLHEKIFTTLSIAEITEFKDGFEAKAREELGTGRISQGIQPGTGTDHSLRGNGGVPDPETDEKAFRAKVAERANQLKAEGKAKTIKEAMSIANTELRKEAK